MSGLLTQITVLGFLAPHPVSLGIVCQFWVGFMLGLQFGDFSVIIRQAQGIRLAHV